MKIFYKRQRDFKVRNNIGKPTFTSDGIRISYVIPNTKSSSDNVSVLEFGVRAYEENLEKCKYNN